MQSNFHRKLNVGFGRCEMAILLHRIFTVDAFQILILLSFQLGICSAEEKFSASFIFGDSLVEAGNNNYITTLSKANYPPNGIDFGRPTGRYTNARTIADIIGSSCVFYMHMTEQLPEFCILIIHLGCIYNFLFVIPGQQAGFKNFTPPYLAPTTRGAVILQGVNYASGGGGIVNETGFLFVSYIVFYPHKILVLYKLRADI